MSTTVSLAQIVQITKQLSVKDKVRLIEIIAPQISHDLSQAQAATHRRSLLGLCADLGPAPSAEIIDAARRDAWTNFAYGDSK